MTPGLGGAWLQKALPRRVPVVLLNDDGTDGKHDSLRIDNRLGAPLPVEHLVAPSPPPPGFPGGPVGNADAAERLAGYREALVAAGLPLTAHLELSGDFGEESGVLGGAKGAARAPGP